MTTRCTAPRLGILTAALCALAACGAPMVGLNSNQIAENGLRPGDAGFTVRPANAPSGPQVDRFAISVLNDIQTASILEGREYCGYIVLGSGGQLSATPARPGTALGCDMFEPVLGQGVIASYHTHGAYAPSRARSAERPSQIDLLTDFNYGIVGYVATPGGRVWVSDPGSRSARQVCGPYCIVSDRAFDPAPSADIAQSYPLGEL